MITRLRAIWADIDASYWFYPGLFAIAALALALFTVWLDRTGQTAWLNQVALIESARPTGARSMLTVIAGSMIGVASTVFSITIAAVAYASGNYGPRLLNNFMEDKGNQLSLATFIATFVYAVTVLRTVRGEEESPAVLAASDPLPGFVPQLSLLVAYLMMAVSIMVLVFFLNHIPASIRVNTVLQGIGERLIHDIRKVFNKPNRGHAAEIRPTGRPIRTEKIGYIQIIDFERLDRLATKEGGRIELAVRTGDFVHPDMPLAYWKDEELRSEPPDDAIRSCFALGGMRTPSQDLHFLIDELVEIGLRALSPGINDPFTAITALHWLGAATAELGQRDLTRSFGKAEKPEEDRLVLPNDDFAHYVSRGFGSMRPSVAASPNAALVMFDTLRDAASALNDASRRQVLEQEGERLMRQARLNLEGPTLELIEARYHQFRQDMERRP